MLDLKKFADHRLTIPESNELIVEIIRLQENNRELVEFMSEDIRESLCDLQDFISSALTGEKLNKCVETIEKLDAIIQKNKE